MRIIRIDVEGAPGRFARISRANGSDQIQVEILCPDLTRTHLVAADDHDDQWSMAECLQETLDGIRGCGGDVREYFNAITRLAD